MLFLCLESVQTVDFDLTGKTTLRGIDYSFRVERSMKKLTTKLLTKIRKNRFLSTMT